MYLDYTQPADVYSWLMIVMEFVFDPWHLTSQLTQACSCRAPTGLRTDCMSCLHRSWALSSHWLGERRGRGGYVVFFRDFSLDIYCPGLVQNLQNSSFTSFFYMNRSALPHQYPSRKRQRKRALSIIPKSTKLEVIVIVWAPNEPAKTVLQKNLQI